MGKSGSELKGFAALGRLAAASAPPAPLESELKGFAALARIAALAPLDYSERCELYRLRRCELHLHLETFPAERAELDALRAELQRELAEVRALTEKDWPLSYDVEPVAELYWRRPLAEAKRNADEAAREEKARKKRETDEERLAGLRAQKAAEKRAAETAAAAAEEEARLKREREEEQRTWARQRRQAEERQAEATKAAETAAAEEARLKREREREEEQRAWARQRRQAEERQAEATSSTTRTSTPASTSSAPVPRVVTIREPAAPVPRVVAHPATSPAPTSSAAARPAAATRQAPGNFTPPGVKLPPRGGNSPSQGVSRATPQGVSHVTPQGARPVTPTSSSPRPATAPAAHLRLVPQAPAAVLEHDQPTPLERRILDAVASKSLGSYRAILAEVGGKRATALAAIQAMHEDGRIRLDGGIFRRGR